jgi:hypothetical protein
MRRAQPRWPQVAAAPVRSRPARPAAVLPTAILLAAVVLAAALLAACGSSGPTKAAGTSSACTAIGAALSDGPDPGADPVGYAEAQIKPLREIHVSDPALRTVVGDLASAYAGVFSSDGKSGAASKAVAAATKKLNAICPGVAS